MSNEEFKFHHTPLRKDMREWLCLLSEIILKHLRKSPDNYLLLRAISFMEFII